MLFNTEIVPHQKDREMMEQDGVEDTAPLDTGKEELQFGALQQQANETHARAQFVINNRNKLNDFYQENTCESLSDPKNLNNLKIRYTLSPYNNFL